MKLSKLLLVGITCFLLDLALAKEQGKHKKVVAEKAEAVKSDSDEDAQHVKEKKEASFSADSLFADAPGPASYAPPVPLSQKSGISAADSVYIIACTGLVQFMTPGLALFYGGLVRQRAATDMMLQNFVALGILSMLWYAVGFSLSFGSGVVVGSPMDFPFWVGVSKHEPWPATHLSKELFATFQMMFAVIAPILMTGTFADRMRFGPYLIFICVWSILVYFPWVHMIWGGGFFQTYGVWDFAGGIVVHTTAGWSALATALALGPRKAKVEGKDLGEPHNVPIVVVGTGILWFGWFGFNGGSALAMNATATTAVTNSHLAAASAVCVWGAIDWMREGKAKLVPMCIACVAGLVVVTPMCGYIEPKMAVFAGVWAGSVCYAAVLFLNKIGVDDALDVWGVHGIGGATGTILIGVLADGPDCLKEIAPESCVFPHTVAASFEQVLLQSQGVLVAIVWSFGVTFAILKIMMMVMKVKPDDSQFENLDEELHGGPAYIFQQSTYSEVGAGQRDLKIGVP